jgi:hypothetical protein
MTTINTTITATIAEIETTVSTGGLSEITTATPTDLDGFLLGDGETIYGADSKESRLLLDLPLESLPFPDLAQTSANSGGQWGPRDGAVLRWLGNDAFMMGGWAGGLVDLDWDDNPSSTCNQVYKTSNRGQTWTRIRNHVPSGWDATHFAPGHWFNVLEAEGALWILNGDTGLPNNGPRNSDVRRSVDGINYIKQNVGNAPYHNYFFTIPGYLNGTFYIFGGHTDGTAGSATNAGWKSVNGGVDWTATPAAPWAARGNVEQLVRHQGKLWLIGGARHDNVDGNRVYYNDVWSFDGTTWTEVLANGHSQWEGRLWANVFEFDGWMYISRGYNATNKSTTFRSRDGIEWEQVNWALTASHADSMAPGPTGVLVAAGNWTLSGTPVNTTSPSYFATAHTDPLQAVQEYVTDSIADRQYIWNPSGTVLEARIGGPAGTIASQIVANGVHASNGQGMVAWDGSSWYLFSGWITSNAPVFMGSGENQFRLRSLVHFRATSADDFIISTNLADRTRVNVNGTMFHTSGNAFVASFSSSASVVYSRFNNTDTTGVLYFALGENATDGSTPFWIGRNGSAHPSRPNATEIINAANADFTLGTNSLNYFRLVAAGRLDAFYELRLPTLTDANAENDSWYYSSTQSAPAYKNSGGTVSKLANVADHAVGVSGLNSASPSKTCISVSWSGVITAVKILAEGGTANLTINKNGVAIGAAFVLSGAGEQITTSLGSYTTTHVSGDVYSFVLNSGTATNVDCVLVIKELA